MAVVIILSICAVIAAGTFVESKYDAFAARKMVYETAWMFVPMIFLALCLIAVMVDRLPWKKRHIPFIFAHIGILVLMAGSLITMFYGIDGTMAIDIGKKSQYVSLQFQNEIWISASYDGEKFSQIHQQEIDFFNHPPSRERPLKFATDGGSIDIIGYKKYVIPQKKISESQEIHAGSAVRVQLKNKNVSTVEWLLQKKQNQTASQKIGLLEVFLGPAPKQGRMQNEIYLQALENQKTPTLLMTQFSKESHKPKLIKTLHEGDSVALGWMGLELTVLQYFPKAVETWDLIDREVPTPLTTSAILVRSWAGEQWAVLDDSFKIFTKDAVYFFSYISKKINLGFPVYLDRFDMTSYEGIGKAKEYESQVRFDAQPAQKISMNEPGKFAGLTFYQSSFQNDESGKPTASIFTVNFDPGRELKYLGSLILSLGIVLLFWQRRSRKKIS